MADAGSEACQQPPRGKAYRVCLEPVAGSCFARARLQGADLDKLAGAVLCVFLLVPFRPAAG